MPAYMELRGYMEGRNEQITSGQRICDKGEREGDWFD